MVSKRRLRRNEDPRLRSTHHINFARVTRHRVCTHLSQATKVEDGLTNCADAELSFGAGDVGRSHRLADI